MAFKAAPQNVTTITRWQGNSLRASANQQLAYFWHCNIGSAIAIFALEARNDNEEGETAMFLADLTTTAMTF